MINWPIILDPLEKLDRVIAPRSGRTPSASISDCRSKINSLLQRYSSGIWYTVTFLLLASAGYFKLQEEEKQKDNPVTTEFNKSSLKGFDA
jgi:hypothetical protein